MANNRQKLVHLHSSSVKVPEASVLEYGEIAVQYANSAATLYVKQANDTIAKFVDELEVDKKINVAQTEIDGRLDALENAQHKDLILNGVTGSAENSAITMTIDSDDILMGSDSSKTITDAISSLNDSITNLEDSAHTHSNKDLLDSYTQSEADLADAVSKKHEHANLSVLSGITSEDVSNWDAAAASAHNHANKDLLDTYTQTETDLADAVSKKHEHANLGVLSGISAEDVSSWDAAAASAHNHTNKDLLDTYTQTEADLADAVSKKHSHANLGVLSGISAEDVSAWNSAEENAKAYASGLVATESARSETAYASKTDFTSVSGKVESLIGDDNGKSIRTIANEELAKQLIASGASESLDTLEEIAAWIQSHPEDAAAMNRSINTISGNLNSVSAAVVTLNADSATTGSVDKKIKDAIDGLDLANTYFSKTDGESVSGSLVNILNGTDIDSFADVEAAISGAVGNVHSHDNLDVLSGITAEKVSAWDSAEENAKAYASSYTETKIADYATSANTYNAITGLSGNVVTKFGNYATSADTVDAIDAAKVAAVGDASAYTDEQIVALSGNVVSVEEKFADYATSANTYNAITGLSGNVVTKFEDYATSADTYAAVTGLSGNIVTKFGNYATSADTVAAIDAAVLTSVTGASGDSYVAASVSDKVVNVSATQSTKDSLAKADTSLQGVASGKTAGVTVDSDNNLDFSLFSINCGEY